MRKLLSVAAILSTLAFAGAAQAQMVRAQDPSTVSNALQQAGYRAAMGKDDSGDPKIDSTSSGSNFSVYFYGCTKNVDCRTVQFYAGWSSPKNASLSSLNEWNKNNRFVRAYLADNGAARLEMDIDLDDGGLSRMLFEDNLEFWVLLMAKFEKHINP